MPHRQVIQAGKLGARFAAHSRRHARRVATSATEPYRDYLQPGQEFLDLYHYQIALGERLEFLEEVLIDIDDRHLGELESDRLARVQRETLIHQLRDVLLKLKATLDSNVGPGKSREIFQEDPRLPREAKGLRQMAQRVFNTLSDPDFRLESSQPGVLIHPQMVADSFAAPLRELGATLKRLNDSESETSHTQSKKDKALKKLLQYDGQVARFFEAFYDLAGHDLLANRLRRSSHVRPVASDEEPGDLPPDGDQEADAPAQDAGVDADAETSTETSEEIAE